jgi:hypothetical protein
LGLSWSAEHSTHELWDDIVGLCDSILDHLVDLGCWFESIIRSNTGGFVSVTGIRLCNIVLLGTYLPESNVLKILKIPETAPAVAPNGPLARPAAPPAIPTAEPKIESRSGDSSDVPSGMFKISWIWLTLTALLRKLLFTSFSKDAMLVWKFLRETKR